MSTQNPSIAELLATIQAQQVQINTLIDVVSEYTGTDPKTDPPTDPPTDPSPSRTGTQLRCVGIAKSTGLQCSRTAIAGTTRCHLHPRDAGTRESKPSQSTVAADTLTVKANRAGAHVAIQALDDALQAGTSLVYVRSNVGALKINKALRKRGYTVDGFAKDGDTRTWNVSGHGHTYTHVMGKFTQGQTEHHRQMVKVA